MQRKTTKREKQNQSNLFSHRFNPSRIHTHTKWAKIPSLPRFVRSERFFFISYPPQLTHTFRPLIASFYSPSLFPSPSLTPLSESRTQGKDCGKEGRTEEGSRGSQAWSVVVHDLCQRASPVDEEGRAQLGLWSAH